MVPLPNPLWIGQGALAVPGQPHSPCTEARAGRTLHEKQMLKWVLSPALKPHRASQVLHRHRQCIITAREFSFPAQVILH